MIKQITVLIVDDSALVRQVLSDMLSGHKDIRVVGAAADPIFAEKYLKKEWPDVIIMDIQMPRKDGLTFMKEIIAKRPTPVIICSSEVGDNAGKAMEALSSGAVSVIPKPKIGIKNQLLESEKIILEAVRSASVSNVGVIKEVNRHFSTMVRPEKKNTADVILPPPISKLNLSITNKIVVIGASAGGTQALEYILKEMPVDCPPIAIVQHMPEKFTEAFANRLNDISDIEVLEARPNLRMKEGRAIVAMGNKHMVIKYDGKFYSVDTVDGPPVSRHRPAVDVLFRSAAKTGGQNILGLILTGMGDDGATGMLEMKNAGCYTISQDKDSSAVFGMPKEAFDKGGVREVLSLYDMPEAIMKFYKL